MEDETVAFRYEHDSGTSYLVPDILSLGMPVSLPTPTGLPDELAVSGRTGLIAIQPNPFNPTTTVSFDLTSDAPASIQVYDMRGQAAPDVGAGVVSRWATRRHDLIWDGKDERGGQLPSGVYFFRLVAGDMKQTLGGVLLR